MKITKHHVYPHRYRNGRTEIKKVTDTHHRAWHIIVGDRHPQEALNYIIRNFMPSEYEELIKEMTL